MARDGRRPLLPRGLVRRAGAAGAAAAVVAGLLPALTLLTALPAYAAEPTASPSTATNTGTATLTIGSAGDSNSYLSPGSETVTITRHGTAETYSGTTPNPDSSTSTSLVRNFDLTAAAPGAYDISVSPGSPGLPINPADTCSSCAHVTGGKPTLTKANNNAAVTAGASDKHITVVGTNLAKAATISVEKMGAADPDVTATVGTVASLTSAPVTLHFPNGAAAESGLRTLVWTNTDGKSASCACLTIKGSVAGHVPNAPTGVKAFPGNRSAEVQWTPGSDGGNVLTGYKISAHPGTASATVGPGTTTGTVKHLTNGKSYTFTVVAMNQRGNSSPGGPSSAIKPHTPKVAVHLPTSVKPGSTPTEFSLDISNTTVTAYPKARIDFTITGLPALQTSRVSMADVNSGTPVPVTLHNAHGSVTGKLPNTGTFALGAGTSRTIPFDITLDSAVPTGTLIVVATVVDATSPKAPVAVASDSDDAQVIARSTRFVPVRPLRFVDTHNGVGVRKGRHGGRTVITIPQTVPNDARAVVLDVGVVNPSRTGSVQVYATGGHVGNRAMSYHAKQSQVATTVTTFSAQHKVTLALSAGSALLTVDLLGYQTDNGTDGGRYTGMAPKRIGDSRGHGQPKLRTVNYRVPGSVPSTAVAVLLNVTATSTHSPGTLKVFAHGGSAPRAVAVQFVKGAQHSNAYVTKMGADRRISVRITGRADVLVDIVGYYARGQSYADRYVPVTTATLVNSAKTGRFTVTLPASVPINAHSVFLTATATGPSAAGSLRAYAAGTSEPATVGLVWAAHRGASNLLAARVGNGAQVTFHVTGASTHVQIEILGYTTH